MMMIDDENVQDDNKNRYDHINHDVDNDNGFKHDDNDDDNCFEYIDVLNKLWQRIIWNKNNNVQESLESSE